MTTRGVINSNFYQIVDVDADGNPIDIKPAFLSNANVANANYANFAGNAFSVSVSNVVGIGNIATVNLDGNSGNILYGNGVFSSAPNVSNANSANFANYANFAGNAFSVSVGNVVGIGNIATVNLDGNSGNILYGNGVFSAVPDVGNANSANFANYANFAGNAFSVAGANVIGAVANANYSVYAGEAFSVTGGNVSGQVANANYAVFSGTSFSVAGANVSGVVANATHANISDSSNSVAGANVIGSVANATHANISDSSNSVAGANVTGSVANATFANISGLSYSVSGANVSGQVANALIAGTVYDNSQPNITSVGTLTGLTSSGNISAPYFLGNVVGNISGNIVVPGLQWNVLFNDSGSANASNNFLFDANANVLSVTGNVSGTYLLGNGYYITGLPASYGNAEVANYLPTFTGNLSAGNANLGNSVVANYFVGNGSLLTGIVATTGNSNYANFAGNAFSVTGSNVSGEVANANYASYAGNAFSVSGPNVIGTVANANYSLYSGESFSVTGGNVSGQVANANYSVFSGTAFSVAGSNVTGEVANANYAAYAGNFSGNVGNSNYANFAGNVVNNSQSNITSLGTLVDLNVEGNIFTNTAVYVGNTSNATGLTNPTIVAKASGATFVQIALVNGSANGSADLVAYGDNGGDSGSFVDVGFTSSNFNDPLYTITKPNDGYMFVQGDDSSALGGNLVLATGSQGFQKDIVFATGGFLDVDEKMRYIHSVGQLYIQPNTVSSNTTTGALRVAGGVGIAGDVYAGNSVNANFFVGDGGFLSNITFTGNVSNANYANFAGEAFSVTGANVSGAVANANYANFAGEAFSVSGANVSGAVANANYAAYAGNFSGNVGNSNYANFAGTVITAAQPNITSVGTLTSLSVTGNLSAGNANLGNLTTSNYFSGILGSGNTYIQIPSVTSGNMNFVANGISVMSLIGSNVNVSGNVNTIGMFATGNISSGNANLGNLTTSNFFSGNGSLLTGITAATVTNNNQPNITSVGTLTTLTVSGNINSNNITNNNLVTANNFVAGTLTTATTPGGTLNLTTTSVQNQRFTGSSIYNLELPDTSTLTTGRYWYINNDSTNNVIVKNYSGTTLYTVLPGASTKFTFTGGTSWDYHSYLPNTMSASSTTANLANLVVANYFSGNGSLLTGIVASSATTSVTVTGNAQPNITSVGTLTSLSVTGNISSGNASLGNLATSNFFSGNGSLLSSIQGANVSGFVANANVANTAYAVSGGNVSGQVANALVAGTVYTNAQPNITSVGNLTSLNVNGNITGSNLIALYGNGGAMTANISVTNYYTSSTNGFNLGFAQSRGTRTSPANVIAGDLIYGFTTAVYTGNGLGTWDGTVGWKALNSLNATITNQPTVANGWYGSNIRINTTNAAANAIYTSTFDDAGGLTVTGNIAGNYFIGNGSALTGITSTATPGGANTNIQYNNNGSMGGISTVTWNGSNLSLGAIGNVKITGGTSGQVISTDGAGNLSFVAQSGGGGATDFVPSFLLGGM
jgi:hypothetical protein